MIDTTWADLGIDLSLDGFDINAEPDDLGIDPELRVSVMEGINEWLAEREIEMNEIEMATFNRLTPQEQKNWDNLDAKGW